MHPHTTAWGLQTKLLKHVLNNIITKTHISFIWLSNDRHAVLTVMTRYVNLHYTLYVDILVADYKGATFTVRWGSPPKVLPRGADIVCSLLATWVMLFRCHAYVNVSTDNWIEVESCGKY